MVGWYERALGRHIETPVLLGLVDYMFRSVPTLFVASVISLCFGAVCFSRTQDEMIFVIGFLTSVLFFVRATVGLIYDSAYRVSMNRSTIENWQQFYLFVSGLTGTLIGIFAARAAVLDNDTVTLIGLFFVALFVVSSLTYTAVRPFILYSSVGLCFIVGTLGMLAVDLSAAQQYGPIYLLMGVFVWGTAQQQAASFTELFRSRQKLSKMASTDTLTGLNNRRSLADTLDTVDPDEDIAILFLDVDGFKPVNDQLGHDAGDRLLKVIADRLRNASGADMLARIGGDEFVVLLRGIEAERAEITAAHLRSVVAGSYHLSGSTVTIDISIGIARRNGSTVSARDLLREADMAMYETKRRHHRDAGVDEAAPLTAAG